MFLRFALCLCAFMPACALEILAQESYYPPAPFTHISEKPHVISPLERDLLAYIEWCYDLPKTLTDGAGNVDTQSDAMAATRPKCTFTPKGQRRRRILCDSLRCYNYELPQESRQILQHIQSWNLDPFSDEAESELIPLYYRHVLNDSGHCITIDDLFERVQTGRFLFNNDLYSFDHLYSIAQLMKEWRIGNCSEYACLMYLLLAVYPKPIPDLCIEITSFDIDHTSVTLGGHIRGKRRIYGRDADKIYWVDPWMHTLGHIPSNTQPDTFIDRSYKAENSRYAYVGMWAYEYHTVMDLIHKPSSPRGPENIPFAYTIQRDLEYATALFIDALKEKQAPSPKEPSLVLEKFLYNFLLQNKSRNLNRKELIDLLLTHPFVFETLIPPHVPIDTWEWLNHPIRLDTLILGLLKQVSQKEWQKDYGSADKIVLFYRLFSMHLKKSYEYVLAQDALLKFTTLRYATTYFSRKGEQKGFDFKAMLFDYNDQEIPPCLTIYQASYCYFIMK